MLADRTVPPGALPLAGRLRGGAGGGPGEPELKLAGTVLDRGLGAPAAHERHCRLPRLCPATLRSGLSPVPSLAPVLRRPVRAQASRAVPPIGCPRLELVSISVPPPGAATIGPVSSLVPAIGPSATIGPLGRLDLDADRGGHRSRSAHQPDGYRQTARRDPACRSPVLPEGRRPDCPAAGNR